MTKSEYLSNSAKLLSVCGIILFAANAFIFAGAYNSQLGAYGQRVSDFTFYIIFALGFLAINGESVGYKRHRDFKNRKFTRFLKYVLLFTFLIRFVKNLVEGMFLNMFEDGFLLVVSKLFLGIFNTFATYPFLFTMISLLYLLRDMSVNKLFYIESVTFLTGIVYAIYRSVNYSVTKCDLTEIGEVFVVLFSSDTVKSVLLLVHLFLFVVMCFFVKRHFDSKILDEQDERIKAKKNMLVAPKIYNTDHVGLDTLEDTFLLPVEAEEY